MTDAEGLGVKLEDRETVIRELKKSLKIKVTASVKQALTPPHTPMRLGRIVTSIINMALSFRARS